MITLTVELQGCLGDHLFQITMAYSFAKAHGCELVFSKNDPIWFDYFRDLDVLPWKCISDSEYVSIDWTRIHYATLDHTIQTPKLAGFYMIYGHIQSNRVSYIDEIRPILQIHEYHRTKAKANLAQLSIHDPDGWIVGHALKGDAKYFKEARATIGKRIGPRTVCWITDDVEWIYRNLYEQGDTVNAISDVMIDFASIALFRHIIVSNIYSWWAAWLNPSNYSDRIIYYEPECMCIETTSG